MQRNLEEVQPEVTMAMEFLQCRMQHTQNVFVIFTAVTVFVAITTNHAHLIVYSCFAHVMATIVIVTIVIVIYLTHSFPVITVSIGIMAPTIPHVAEQVVQIGLDFIRLFGNQTTAQVFTVGNALRHVLTTLLFKKIYILITYMLILAQAVWLYQIQ